ncbi:Glutamine dumper 1 [Heracleum sosnowskyi]|uniref:Glutamine dumper 1 n=1 Tax=Heracleum sosnowskyi TaxID=360622 RepID=A0AAD8N7Q8_9APIA|nr:Glutamine dumper 1 [Heracleum sosnowskyi]
MTEVANAPLTMPLQKSPWHSPVPYLFGGLAAMLGLIAFALLILACSYWKLSGSLENGEETAERDLEAGDDVGDLKPAPVLEEKFLVIMAGQEKPTYLATPKSSSSRTSSFGSTTSDSNNSSCSSDGSLSSEKSKDDSMIPESCLDQVQMMSTNMVNREATGRTVP